ncbi:MAG TPA: hypothetical protein VD790_12870 [Thermoleophilaceae bacterium]|nr:hypothetical protein [Thermoleophilaceae bacterium]
MVRDFEEGVAEKVDAWDEQNDRPGLQPAGFEDGGDVILVQATVDGEDRHCWFTYTMSGPRIADWEAHEDEASARAAAGL